MNIVNIFFHILTAYIMRLCPAAIIMGADIDKSDVVFAIFDSRNLILSTTRIRGSFFTTAGAFTLFTTLGRPLGRATTCCQNKQQNQ